MNNIPLYINLKAASPRSALVRSAEVLTPVRMNTLVVSDSVGLDIYLADGEGALDADSGSEVLGVQVGIGSPGAQPTGGTYSLYFGGQASAEIAYNATAAQIQAALEAVATIGAGNVSVTGQDGVFQIEFVGAKALSNQGPISQNTNSLFPASGIALSVLQEGSSIQNEKVSLRFATNPVAWVSYAAPSGDHWTAQLDLYNQWVYQALAGQSELSTFLEVEIATGGANPRTVLQIPVTILNDVLNETSQVEAPGLDPVFSQSESDQRYVQNRFDLTQLTGGISTALDYVTTTSMTVGTVLQVRSSGVDYLYRLTTGTDAESSPAVIRPDDYHGTTNTRVWKLAKIAAASFTQGITGNQNFFAGQTSISRTGTASYVGQAFTANSESTHTSGLQYSAAAVGSWKATSAASAAGCVALYVPLNSTGSTGNLGSTSGLGLAAAYLTTAHAGTGTAALVQGAYIYTSTTGSAGTVAEQIGLDVKLTYNSSNTAALGAGLMIRASDGSYPASARYGIYQAGSSDLNYFAAPLGIGTAPGSTQALSVAKTYTDTAADSYATGFTATQNAQSAASSHVTAGYGYALTTWGNSQTFTGSIRGVLGRATHGGTATIAIATGLHALCTNNNTGTITALYGVRIGYGNANAGGAVTTAYGIHIETSTTTGPITNRYGIYQAGTSDVNYLAGELRASVASGSMYQDHGATSVTFAASNTWYELTTGFSSLNLYGMTLTSSHALTVTTAGKYLVVWSLSLEGAANAVVEGAIIVNGSTTTRYAGAERKLSASGDTGNMGSNAILSLAANDQVSLAFNNNTNTTGGTVDHCWVSLVRVGN